MNELHLFAGAGGGILGGMLLGHTTVCAVEIEEYPRKVLLQRQRDGILPRFPIWDDITTFDGNPWRGRVDVVCGGFPCQDISAAGKGAGITGERSGLWGEMARVIREVRPRFVFVENSPMLTSRGLGTVLGDLAAMGFDARWGVLGAHHVGAPHKRDRIWIVANSSNFRSSDKRKTTQQPSSEKPATRSCSGESTDSDFSRLEGSIQREITKKEIQEPSSRCSKTIAVCNSTSVGQQGSRSSWFRSDPAEDEERKTDYAFSKRVGSVWGIESSVGRVAHGVANRMDRLKAIGNGQVASVAALAWKILNGKESKT